MEDLHAVAELHLAGHNRIQLHSGNQVDDAGIVVEVGVDRLDPPLLGIQVIQVDPAPPAAP